MRRLVWALLWLYLADLADPTPQQAFEGDSSFMLGTVTGWATRLGIEIEALAEAATQEKEILRKYRAAGAVVELDPEKEVQRMAKDMGEYLKSKSKISWKAKMSLESREMEPKSSWDGYNEFFPPAVPNKDGNGTKTGIHFVRYLGAKTGDDSARLTREDYIPPINVIHTSPNGLLYDLAVNLSHSTVHVPTPTYNRKPELLSRVKWSNIDDFFRSHKEVEAADLGFQMYCAKQGFLRFFPGREWPADPESEADMFDCRNSEWYINGATNSKNILILLDMSGSMLGQRFEIAKQTIETIMETLTENDFFNIVWFNDEAEFLADCFRDELIQANLRNKLMLRSKLNLMKASGIANYEKALPLAFNTLRGLRRPNVTTRQALGEKWTKRPSDLILGRGQVLLMDEEDVEIIVNSSATLGCNSAIMLITDGASDTYSAIFNRFNPDRKIRLFSYLIGDEATDFREVSWMACQNHGYMVHIANLADVQEKVQHYVQVMARPVAAAGETSTETTPPIWTGTYEERLFHPKKAGIYSSGKKRIRHIKRSVKDVKLVTTVAYPVVVNGTLEGVVGVTVPMLELAQLAPVFLLGASGYSFLVDNNGYAMYHPQMRPFDVTSSLTAVLKPNYNSMDFLELEVLQDNSLESLSPDFNITSLRLRPPYYVGEREAAEEAAEAALAAGVSTTTAEPIPPSAFEVLWQRHRYFRTLETAARDSNAAMWSQSSLYRQTLSFPGAPLFPAILAAAPSLCVPKAGFVVTFPRATPRLAVDGLHAHLFQDENYTMTRDLDYYSEIRSELVEGRSSNELIGNHHYSFDILYALDPGEPASEMPVKRVYKQTNEYFYRPIEGTLFTVGLAVPRTSRYRVEPGSPVDYRQVSMDWFTGQNWRLHPEWRYCFVNSSDSGKREAAFTEYVKDMRNRGALPPRCLRPRLVNLLLFDAQQTAFLDADWVAKWQLDQAKGVHLVFFATQSGLTRYVDSLIDDIVYDPNEPELETQAPPPTTTLGPMDGNETVTTAAPPPPPPPRDPVYLHYVHRRTRGREEVYYQRALRNPPNTYVFDLNAETRVYKANEYQSVYGNRENVSLLVTASKALYLDKGGNKAPLGVVGFEMLYDSLAGMALKASNGDCSSDPAGLRCYLLDEHGYVVFSSDLRLGSARFASTSTSDTPPDYAAFHALPPAQRGPLGKFFGDLDAPERAIMKGLTAQKVYQEVVYIDFQAICPDEHLDNAASRLFAPMLNLWKVAAWIWRQAVLICKELGVWGFLYSFIRPIEAYTSNFRGISTALPCDKASRFYILDPLKDRIEARDPAAADVTTSNVCGSAACSMYSYAAPVPGTNLLLVAFKLRPESKTKLSQCYNAACTAHMDPTNPKIRFLTVYNASDKIFTPHGCKPDQRLRRAPALCYPHSNKTEAGMECASALRLSLPSLLLLLLPALLGRLLS